MTKFIVCRYSYQSIEAPSAKAASELADANPARGVFKSFVVRTEREARGLIEIALRVFTARRRPVAKKKKRA